MNDRQTRKFEAFNTTATLLEDTPAATSVPGLPARLNLLRSKLHDINALACAQMEPTAARTARRDEVHAALATATLHVANALALHAATHGLVELAVIARVSPSTFVRARVSHRSLIARRILEAAQTERVALTEYGISDAVLAAFEALIEAAREGRDEPRVVIADRRATTLRLAALFREVDALLSEQIDRLLYPLHRTDPAFAARYLAARAVVAVRTAARAA